MRFSTYRWISYIGLGLFPFLMAGILYLDSKNWNIAVGFAIFLTLVIVPLQFWQLSRLQSRLDDYGGSIPMGWAFDWDLEDDSLDDDEDDSGGTSDPSGPASAAPLPDPQPQSPNRESDTGTICGVCGKASWVEGERYCPYCGATLNRKSPL